MPKRGTNWRESSSLFKTVEQSVGGWTIEPSKRCFEAVTAYAEKAGSMDKRKMTDKGREYTKEIFDKKSSSLVLRIIGKSSEIEVFLYSQ